MKNVFITLFITLVCLGYVVSQNATQQTEFKPSGKPFAKIFSNFNSELSEGNNRSSFEIRRAYFGYKYKYSKNISAQLTFDVGNPDAGKIERTAYLKHAFLRYNVEKLEVNFGITKPFQFQFQQDIWGHRFLLKSFQDEYNMGPSADMGLTAAYKLHKKVSIDAAILNGEGYKQLQNDNTFKGSIGLSIKPINGFLVRAFYDHMAKTEIQSTIGGFIAYTNKKIAVGAEYNIRNNHDNVKAQNYSGYSFYASYQANNKLEFFGRYDAVTSETISGETEAWNSGNDGQLIIFGAEYSLVKGVKIAPNFRLWQPEQSDLSEISYIYINLEINL